MALCWLAFFLSGVAGLSYELIWMRYLVQLFGASTPAVSATVAIFFAGLAAGALLGGRLFDGARRPARRYALLELGVGACAAALPWLFDCIDALVARRGGAGTPMLLLASVALLAVPTTLLGATFPAMAAVVRGRLPGGAATGAFYGVNTLGAVAGCLVASFLLLPRLDRAHAGLVMVAVNALAALLLLLAPSAPAPDSGETAAAGEAAAPRRPAVIGTRLALLLAGGSGLLGIAIEVLWTRALVLTFPATVFSFALILAAYLCGIGLGALAIAAYCRRAAPRADGLALLLLLVAGGGLLTLALLPQLGPWTLQLLSAGYLGSYTAYLLWLGAAAVLSMLPATLGMGALLPLVIALSDDTPRSAGRLYAVNTLCGIAGSLGATFLVMPRLGVSRTLMLGALGYLAMGLLVAARAGLARRLQGAAAGLLVLGLGLAAADLAPEVDPARVADEAPGRWVLFRQDAATASVAVREEGGIRSLLVNNHAALNHTEPTSVAMHYGLGHLPLLLHGRPRRALLVGFATGTTLSAMAAHGLTNIDCVELHESLPQLAPLFWPQNHGVWRDRRLRLHVDDGRRFLTRPGPAYDVIVGDLYFPRDAGVGALYSVDYFRAAARRLAPGGLNVTWLPLPQMGPEELASIAQAFLQAFPQAEAWVGWWNPLFPVLGLVGARDGAVPAAPARLEELLAGALGTSLKNGFANDTVWPPGPALGLEVPAQRRLLDNGQLRRLAGGAVPNSLARPLVEFAAPRVKFEEQLLGVPLAQRNLRRLGELVPLGGTPWQVDAAVGGAAPGPKAR